MGNTILQALAAPKKNSGPEVDSTTLCRYEVLQSFTRSGWGNFTTWNSALGGGFKCFLFSPLLGEDSQFDEYFSKGLKPPTRKFCWLRRKRCWRWADKQNPCFFATHRIYVSGQMIVTSNDLGPQKVAFWKENFLISWKYKLVNYYNLARKVFVVWDTVFRDSCWHWKIALKKGIYWFTVDYTLSIGGYQI